ncbi:MAG: 16S rRNA (cytosine(1402)-N(4))-methyltransferase RsmH [SAR86 cluster bacterium]|uniref:Ribosomal RNA small subunit methyltransferase H n=1 Tax=SAR86 cluster bacterium TaxID=2030880 RepID=A0A937I3B7_9GAMM|nr:16S rRNA (cytosine(1402)-N(4))-methyltransferase RsmH [SAR86 cluster bacterium]
MNYSHEPVLLKETVNNLIYDKSGSYLDCTFGLGGHSKKILENLNSDGSLYSIDKDKEVKNYANLIKDERFNFQKSTFSNISSLFSKNTMNGVLFDLGVSSLQLDKPERGFSFMREGELDMRFDNSSGMSAKEWINTASEKELADVFYFLGEERKSRQFAKKIIQARKETNISSTKNLADLFKPKGFQKKHPATNIFRGIRILINNEFEELKEGLISAIKVLKDRGILAVISFHSAEDRIVKNFFKKDYKNFFEGIHLKNVNKIKPSKEEKSTNPRSRSAILRIGEIEYVS